MAAHTHVFFDDNHDGIRNAVSIGQCKHHTSVEGRPLAAWAHLSDLPRAFHVTCAVDSRPHHWQRDIELAQALARLGKRGARTLKMQVLVDLAAWNSMRVMAFEATGTELVKYNPHLKPARGTSRGEEEGNPAEEADESDVEVVPRPGLRRRHQTRAGGWSTYGTTQEPGKAEDAETPGALTRVGDDEGSVAAALHLLGRIAVRHGQQLAKQAPTLLTSWYANDMPRFYACLFSVVPGYFCGLPSWMVEAATPLAMVALNRVAQTPVVSSTIDLLRSIVSTPTPASMIILPPIDPDGAAFRRALEAAQRAAAGSC